MNSVYPTHYARPWLWLVILLCTAALSACVSGGKRPSPTRTAPPPSPYVQAHNALTQGNYARAELLAQKILQNPAISGKERADTSLVYAKAASMNNHPNAALAALDGWRLAAPGADTTPLWQEIWSDSMGQLYPNEGQSRAHAILADAARVQQAHNLAAAYLAVRQWESGSLGESFPMLQEKYAKASSKTVKAQLETALARELDKAKTPAVSLIADQVTPENQNSFPYNIILLDQLRRQTHNPGTKSEAEAALNRLQNSLNLAEPALIHGPKTTPISPLAAPVAPVSPISSGDVKGKPVVLTLPLSGQFSGIAAKIAAGAQAACNEISASGTEVSLVIIDTEQSDWLARVEGLPKDAVIVGGPLRQTDYAAAKAQGITSRRAFFTFLSSLDGQDEGTAAWRFFSSPEDQVRVLTGLTSRMGIQGYGILYPEDAYGQKMASLFEDQVRQAGAGTVNKAGYPPKSPSAWLRTAGVLLATNKNPENAASATFRAIYLPDDWKSMEVLVPNIFYYGETRQLLLGSALWGPALSSSKAVVDPQQFGLAVFPGSWDASGAGASRLNAALAGKSSADFWTALGYDFAKFSSSMAIPAGFSASSVNNQLQQTQITWSMAPLNWSPSGLARQEMYLFTPATGGAELLNESEFINKYNAAWK